MQNYTLQPVWSGKGEQWQREEKWPTCKCFFLQKCLHVNELFSLQILAVREKIAEFHGIQELLQRRVYPWPHSNAWESQVGLSQSFINSSLGATAPNLTHSFRGDPLQPNTKVTLKSHKLARPAWEVCRVIQMCSLHFLLKFLHFCLTPNPNLEPVLWRVKLQLRYANRKFLCKMASAVTCEMRCKEQLQLFTN